jgi:hypothetical protein
MSVKRLRREVSAGEFVKWAGWFQAEASYIESQRKG